MANDFKGYATRLPWRITEASEKKGREIVGADGSTVAKLTGLDLPNAELIVESVNNRRAPSSATTAGERQSIDTPTFRKLLDEYDDEASYGSHAEARKTLIAHIDTWAARSAANTVAPDQQKIDSKTAETRIDTGLYGSASLARSAGDAVPANVVIDAVNMMLWLYRRLPRAYERPPFVEKSITDLANIVGVEVGEYFTERGAAPGNTAQPSGKEE
jgi:hypothetical protein